MRVRKTGEELRRFRNGLSYSIAYPEMPSFEYVRPNLHDEVSLVLNSIFQMSRTHKSDREKVDQFLGNSRIRRNLFRSSASVFHSGLAILKEELPVVKKDTSTIQTLKKVLCGCVEVKRFLVLTGDGIGICNQNTSTVFSDSLVVDLSFRVAHYPTWGKESQTLVLQTSSRTLEVVFESQSELYIWVDSLCDVINQSRYCRLNLFCSQFPECYRNKIEWFIDSELYSMKLSDDLKKAQKTIMIHVSDIQFLELLPNPSGNDSEHPKFEANNQSNVESIYNSRNVSKSRLLSILIDSASQGCKVYLIISPSISQLVDTTMITPCFGQNGIKKSIHPNLHILSHPYDRIHLYTCNTSMCLIDDSIVYNDVGVSDFTDDVVLRIVGDVCGDYRKQFVQMWNFVRRGQVSGWLEKLGEIDGEYLMKAEEMKRGYERVVGNNRIRIERKKSVERWKIAKVCGEEEYIEERISGFDNTDRIDRSKAQIKREVGVVCDVNILEVSSFRNERNSKINFSNAVFRAKKLKEAESNERSELGEGLKIEKKGVSRSIVENMIHKIIFKQP